MATKGKWKMLKETKINKRFWC